MWNQVERRSPVFVFTNLNGLAGYFGKMFPLGVIRQEVRIATLDFRPRQHASAEKTQLEFVKLCETRLVRRMREMKLEV